MDKKTTAGKGARRKGRGAASSGRPPFVRVLGRYVYSSRPTFSQIGP
jgi:hypothetical protein